MTAAGIELEGPAPAPSGAPPRPRFPIPLYPTLLSLAFVTELFIASGVSPFSSVRVFVAAVLIPVTLTLIGRLVMGDRDRGALVAALAILAIMAGVDLRLGIVVSIAIVLLVVERYVLPEKARTIRWPRITTILTRLTAVFALAVGIHAVQAGTPGVVARAIGNETPLRPAVAAASVEGDPDIYMILLDGYARPDVLAEQFAMRGHDLVPALEDRGFDVAERSRSNYTLTAEVLASMFDMAHLEEIPRMQGLLAGTDSRVQGLVLRDVINENRTFDTLHDRGYFIEAISSGFEEVSIREADRFVDTGELNEVEIGMLRRTTLGDVLQALAPDFVSGQMRSRIERTLEATVDGSDRPTDRPVFVFSHLPSPHPPWVFHADGSPRTVTDLEAIYADTPDSTGLSDAELRRGYADAIVDLDRRVLDTLDELDATIESRGRPAITILWSDHGSWIGADGGDIRLRFKNLLAVRSSGRQVAVEPDVTTVNLLGGIFEQVFGTPFERRADTTYRFGPRDIFDLVVVDDDEGASAGR